MRKKALATYKMIHKNLMFIRINVSFNYILIFIYFKTTCSKQNYIRVGSYIPKLLLKTRKFAKIPIIQ